MSVTPIGFPTLSSADLTPTDVSGMGGVQGATAASGTAGVDPTGSTASTDGADFGNLVLDGLDRLQGLTHKADGLAVQAATGNLSNIHDYTIAASEAQVATQLTVAVRNQALDAFNKILQMQV
jgi:flagellar hook-basal body complex protein FliE